MAHQQQSPLYSQPHLEISFHPLTIVLPKAGLPLQSSQVVIFFFSHTLLVDLEVKCPFCSSLQVIYLSPLLLSKNHQL